MTSGDITTEALASSRACVADELPDHALTIGHDIQRAVD